MLNKTLQVDYLISVEIIRLDYFILNWNLLHCSYLLTWLFLSYLSVIRLHLLLSLLCAQTGDELVGLINVLECTGCN